MTIDKAIEFLKEFGACMECDYFGMSIDKCDMINCSYREAINVLISKLEEQKIDKIYQVCREYYDTPDSEILKTFSHKHDAEIFLEEYKKSERWKNATCDECLRINEYDVD